MNRILLVDDDHNVLSALRRELRDDYEVESFNSPGAALARCGEVAFDLVVADYRMPEMNGVEFLQRLGAIQPDTARLVLSGEMDMDALARAINETHIYRFLAKPWQAAELKAMIRQALAYRAAILENRRLAGGRRGAAAPGAGNETTRVLLVDGGSGLLQFFWHEMELHGGHENLSGIMRGEITPAAPEAASGHRFATIPCDSGAAAVAQARKPGADLIIASQVLPDMDGIQCLGRCREAQPDAARILFSDRADLATLTRAVNEAEVQAFVAVSWNPQELRASPLRKAWYVHQLEVAVAQALTARELALANRALAGR